MLEVTQRQARAAADPVGAWRASWAASASICPARRSRSTRCACCSSTRRLREGEGATGRTLEGLGIDPTALEIVLPTYLTRFRERGEFTQVHSV